MKLELNGRRNFRKAGGLFVGMRFSFPLAMVDLHPEIDEVRCHYQRVNLSLGFLFWTVDLTVNYSFVIVD